MSGLYVAIKLLTSSDLSFFQVHLKSSKQKAINLNSDIFIERFFPGLQGSFTEIHFPLIIIGPEGKSPHKLSRKILRSPGAKNWRLNGEFIFNPEDDPARYDSLQPGDYAVLAFEGAERPISAKMILIGKTTDQFLHEIMSNNHVFVGRNTMVEVSQAKLAEYRHSTQDIYPGVHPFDHLDAPDTIEDVLYGKESIIQSRPFGDGRSIALTPQELRRQLLSAQTTGQIGEELFGHWLLTNGHTENDFEWVSQSYARAAYDYKIMSPKWLTMPEILFVDVKATNGQFERPFHMSIAEIRWAARNEGYRIARIFAIADGLSQMKILKGISHISRVILEKFSALPPTLEVDSVTLQPSQFEVEIEGPILVVDKEIPVIEEV